MANIDNSKCKDAIEVIKTHINNCFTKCNTKGSTYKESKKTTSELIKKIDAIPSGSSVNMNAQPCDYFPVTWAEAYENEDGLVIPNEFTINFGSIGTSFKALVIYSATRDGYFSITRIDSTKCVISAHPFVKYSQDEVYGVSDLGYGSYRANYTVNGGSITFTRANYPNDGVNYAGGNDDNFRDLPTQIAQPSADDTSDSYKLELINVIV